MKFIKIVLLVISFSLIAVKPSQSFSPISVAISSGKVFSKQIWRQFRSWGFKFYKSKWDRIDALPFPYNIELAAYSGSGRGFMLYAKKLDKLKERESYVGLTAKAGNGLKDILENSNLKVLNKKETIRMLNKEKSIGGKGYYHLCGGIDTYKTLSSKRKFECRKKATSNINKEIEELGFNFILSSSK
jgi:hypothetical protein